MNVLFVLENLSSRCGANVGASYNMAKELSKSDRIYGLTRFDKYSPIESIRKEFFKDVYSFKSSMLEKYQTYGLNFKELTGVNRFKYILLHPMYVFMKLDKELCDQASMIHSYKKAIEKSCRDNKIDIVIASVAPYYLAVALKNAKISAKKVLIQYDPYTYNYCLSSKLTWKRRRAEKSVISKMDLLFIVDFVETDMRRKGLIIEDSRVIAFGYPGINNNVMGEKVSTSKETVDLIYSGQFYQDIRNPGFLLSLMQKLPSNYILHFVGGGADEIVAEHKKKLGKRLRCYGWKSVEQCHELIKNANILVNVNNSITNQMSSKLIEYISTGKPILNIVKSKNCPSLKYTEKYGLVLNIYEKESIDQITVDSVVQFVNRSIGKRIDNNEVLRMYKDNTLEYIVENMRNSLLGLFN